VKGRPIERLGHDLTDILDGRHAVHPSKGARLRRIDRADASVRHGAAHDLAVEHPGQAQIVHVLGPAGDLGGALETTD
jgi:hypothetical protein